jgi:hypothetical protein
MRRSPRVSILNVALLRLRRKPLCGLASDQNLPFLHEHLGVLNRAIWSEWPRLMDRDHLTEATGILA